MKSWSQCTIVVGGQYGSEGKGKVVGAVLERSDNSTLVSVRCGGPNSGHTVQYRGSSVVLKALPSGVIKDNALLCIPAGGVVNLGLLQQEMTALNVDKSRVIVDPRAVIMTTADSLLEKAAVQGISSTGSGNGNALMRRMRRDIKEIKLIGDLNPSTTCFRIARVAAILHETLDNGGHVVIEGNQGFGLSLLHGPFYPFTTSRDVTASGFASECGLAPSDITQVIVTIRTFPIRVGSVVGGPGSGPMMDEITWERVAEIGRWPDPLPEYTSVTKRLRRVGLFDLKMVKDACRYNGATDLAVMGLDRLDFECKDKKWKELTQHAKNWLADLEIQTGVPVAMIGTGPGNIETRWDW